MTGKWCCLYDVRLAGSHSHFFCDGSRNQKSLDYQLGTVHVTTHRLLYIDAAHPKTCSVAIPLAAIVQTDFYAGFLKSSPKITLFLKDGENRESEIESWVCQVCSYRNPPGLGDTTRKCSLCGVIRELPPQTTDPRPKEPVYSGHISPTLSSSASAVPRPTDNPIPCPACTFLNHSSLRSCEICSTPLEQQIIARSFKSAPASRPDSPSVVERESIKISFRKGGDKSFYAALKRTLIGKAWEVRPQRVPDFEA